MRGAPQGVRFLIKKTLLASFLSLHKKEDADSVRSRRGGKIALRSPKLLLIKPFPLTAFP